MGRNLTEGGMPRFKRADDGLARFQRYRRQQRWRSMKRGDLVTVSARGDLGKPRPA